MGFLGFFGGVSGAVFFLQNVCSESNIGLSHYLHFLIYFHFASECLLPPGPEAEITKCLSRRGRFPGSPGKLISGGRIFTFLGDPPKSGGRGGGVISSLLVIYIGRGVWGSSSDKQVRRRISNAPPLPEAGAQHYRAGGER